MIRTKGILHFTLPVTDIERSKQFYMDLLGCTLLTQSPRMAFMQSGEDYFILAKSLTPIDPNAPGDVRIHHAFLVDGEEYDAARETMKANGFEVLHEEYRKHGANMSRDNKLMLRSALAVLPALLALALPERAAGFARGSPIARDSVPSSRPSVTRCRGIPRSNSLLHPDRRDSPPSSSS